MNGAGARWKYVVWYPALGTCLGFAYVGERGVEPFGTVTVAADENKYKTGTKEGRK